MAQNKKNISSKEKQLDSVHYVKRMWQVFSVFLGLIILFFILLSFGLLGFMPSFEELENPKSSLVTEVYSADGEVLGYIGYENRSNVRYDEISPNIIQALIATEDVRFYKHSGIDLRGLFRVLGKTIIGQQRGSGGGSTITQQLAKNLFHREGRGKLGLIYSKLKEWVVATKLERNYSKEEILALYLNTVDFGSHAFGIKTAAQTFFGKHPSEVNVQEAAMLVGLLKAPSSYNPSRHYDRALDRRNVVLSQMSKYGELSDEACDSIQVLPIDLGKYSPGTHNDGLAPYFREKVRLYMREWCKTHYKGDGEPYDLYKDGLRVYTTIDSRMQRYAEGAVKEHMGKFLQPQFFKQSKGYKSAPFTGINDADIEKYYLQAMKNSDRYRTMKRQGVSDTEIRKAFNEKVDMTVFSWRGDIDTIMSPWDSLRYYKFFLNTGVMGVEPQTGHIKVYVGGINYKYFKFDNVSQGRRQVGSTFKPFVYASAVKDNHLSPCFEVDNNPVTFPDYDGWTPRNSGDKREGEMVPLKWALANSINYISARLIKDYTTPKNVAELAKNMGISSPIEPVPAICLGTPDLSVWEMSGAMATFANAGEHIQPIFITKITDNKGVVLETFTSKRNQALDEETAYLMIEMMKGVVESGTGARLRYRYGLKNVIAGKTGTTDNNSDGWFIGITPRLATAVWVGGELRSIHFRSMALGQGASMALPIFGLMMQGMCNDKDLGFYQGNFAVPANVSVEMDCSQYKEEEAERIQSEFDKGW